MIGRREEYLVLSEEKASAAIETVKNILHLIEPGPFIVHKGPKGELHYDIPLMYQGFALDRIHYDPWRKRLLPKGVPHSVGRGEPPEASYEEVAGLFKELRVLKAAEFRESEQAWAIPVAWRSFIVAHVKIGVNGRDVVPDYPLTEEARRRV